MIVVGVPCTIPEMFTMTEVAGGSPYGATTMASPDGSRVPSTVEKRIARHQGCHVATIAARIVGANDSV
jgi:NAD(P)H dehydrogenase (quinone)